MVSYFPRVTKKIRKGREREREREEVKRRGRQDRTKFSEPKKGSCTKSERVKEEGGRERERWKKGRKMERKRERPRELREV